MSTAVHFLNCKVRVVHFGYLGIHVRANPLMASIWDPHIKTLCMRFIGLGRRSMLAMGGKRLF